MLLMGITPADTELPISPGAANATPFAFNCASAASSFRLFVVAVGLLPEVMAAAWAAFVELSGLFVVEKLRRERELYRLVELSGGSCVFLAPDRFGRGTRNHHSKRE